MPLTRLIHEQLAANHRIAVAIVEVLAESGEDTQRARAIRALGDEAPAIHQVGRWIAPKRLVAMFEAAALSRNRARRVGQKLIGPGGVGLALCYGGLATPEKAYRRVDDLLARETGAGRYRADSIGHGCARIAFDPASQGLDPRDTWPAELGPAVCGMREGMLETVPMLFGLLPGTVRETQCAFDGALHCEFEVRWTHMSRQGVAGGLGFGAIVGGLTAWAAGWPLWALALSVSVLALLCAGAGRAVDLARQLEAIGGARRGQLALLEQLESGLAERLDDIARFGDRPAQAGASLSRGEGLVPVSQVERLGGSAGAVMAGAMGQVSSDLQRAAQELSADLAALKTRVAEGQSAPEAWDEGLDGCVRLSGQIDQAAAVLNRALGGRGENRPHAPKAMVERALARFRAGQAGEFIVEQALADELPQISCDDVQIEYVIQELLAHAQAVSGSDPGAHAHLTLRSAHGGVEVWVEDQGACLEPELIDRIFDPFVEGDSDSVGAGQGGLRECLGIIEEHGGEFVVQPGAGQGNRISFVLPAHTPA